ncbi:hypothetical protein JHK86_002790 [Glycine max]|nr:hypothetical protein JHK86_002790 [Glycine max]
MQEHIHCALEGPIHLHVFRHATQFPLYLTPLLLRRLKKRMWSISSSLYTVKRSIIPLYPCTTNINFQCLFTSSISISLNNHHTHNIMLTRNPNQIPEIPSVPKTEPPPPVPKEQPVLPTPEIDPFMPPEIVTDPPSTPFEPDAPKPPLSPPGPDMPLPKPPDTLPPRPPDVVPPHPPGPDIVPPPTTPPDIVPPTGPAIIL